MAALDDKLVQYIDEAYAMEITMTARKPIARSRSKARSARRTATSRARSRS